MALRKYIKTPTAQLYLEQKLHIFLVSPYLQVTNAWILKYKPNAKHYRSVFFAYLGMDLGNDLQFFIRNRPKPPIHKFHCLFQGISSLNIRWCGKKRGEPHHGDMQGTGHWGGFKFFLLIAIEEGGLFNYFLIIF